MSEIKLQFEAELRALINRYCKENGSNTPDFLLAAYLMNCLRAFDLATREREKWHGRYINGRYINHSLPKQGQSVCEHGNPVPLTCHNCHRETEEREREEMNSFECSQINYIIGYLEGIADIQTGETPIYEALQKPIAMLRKLSGIKEEKD